MAEESTRRAQLLLSCFTSDDGTADETATDGDAVMQDEKCLATLARRTAELERKARGLDWTSVYGEVTLAAFVEIIAMVRWFGGLKVPGGVFHDIGSGTGKLVLASSLLHSFDRCWGIEWLSSLHDRALESRTAFLKIAARSAATISHQVHAQCKPAVLGPSTADDEVKAGDPTEVVPHVPCIDFVLGDFTLLPLGTFRKGVLIVAHCTTWSPEMMARMALQAADAPRGAWFVTVSKALPRICHGKLWELRARMRLAMSWGGTVVYFQERSRAALTDFLDEVPSETAVAEVIRQACVLMCEVCSHRKATCRHPHQVCTLQPADDGLEVESAQNNGGSLAEALRRAEKFSAGVEAASSSCLSNGTDSNLRQSAAYTTGRVEIWVPMCTHCKDLHKVDDADTVADTAGGISMKAKSGLSIEPAVANQSGDAACHEVDVRERSTGHHPS